MKFLFHFRCSNSQGTCTIYDNKKLAIGVGTLVLGLNITIVILISLACFAEKRRIAREQGNALEIENTTELENKGYQEKNQEVIDAKQ